MNTVNYEIKNSVANNTLNIAKKSGGNYDELAQKIFRSDCPYFAAPMNEVTINGETIFKYDLGNYISIENINMKMTGSEFMRLLKNLITPFTDCCDWMLDSHYFIMDPQFVFISAYDFKIRYIYSFDLDDFCEDIEIAAFFSAVIKTVRITDSTDLNNELLRMVVDNNVSVASLLDMVDRYEKAQSLSNERSVPTHLKEKSIPQSQGTVVQETPKKTENKPENRFPKIPSIIQAKTENKEEKKETADNLFSSERDTEMEKLFGGSKSKKKEAKSAKGKESFLSFLKKDKSDPSKNDGSNPAKTAYRADNHESEETVFAVDDSETEFAGAYPYFLLKEKSGGLDAPQRIDVILDENGEMYIGRKSESSNYNGYKFDEAFKKISRQQAKLTYNGMDYLITNLSLSNKTIMNGQTLQPNISYPISDGSAVIFGDCQYVYEFRVI